MQITHSLEHTGVAEKYVEVSASHPSHIRFVTQSAVDGRIEPWIVLTRVQAKHLADAINRMLYLTKRKYGTRRSNQSGTGNS